MGLGECRKVHDLALRADYKKERNEKEYFFEFEVSFELMIFWLEGWFESNVSYMFSLECTHCPCIARLLF